MRFAKDVYRNSYNLLNKLLLPVKNLLPAQNLYQRKADGKSPLAIFSIKDFNHGRYAFQLLHYFSLAGYQVCIHDSFSFLLHLDHYDRLLLKQGNIIGWRQSYRSMVNEDTVYVQVNQDDTFKGWPGKHFQLDLDIFSPDVHEGEPVLPYYAHPLMQLRLIREQQQTHVKSGGVLFYGSDDLQFDKYWLKDYFKKLTRGEIGDIIQQSELPVVYPQSFEELVRLLDEGCEDRLVFVNNSRFRIPEDKWLPTLGRFSFFIASPGFTMP